MKFKITKLHAKLLSSKFKETDADYDEIELEPVCETAREAILHDQIKNEAFEKGREYGYREGWFDRDNCKSFYHKDGYCRPCGCCFGKCKRCI